MKKKNFSILLKFNSYISDLRTHFPASNKWQSNAIIKAESMTTNSASTWQLTMLKVGNLAMTMKNHYFNARN